MKRMLLFAGLLGAGILAFHSVSSGHGGQYRGPGDTVPPGAGGPGTGNPGPSGPSTPGPAGPSTPGPAGPSTPGPATPGPTSGGGGGGPRTGAGLDLGPALELWEFWWEYNKEPYLNLKGKIHSVGVVTGSDDFFLGRVPKSEAQDTLKPTDDQIRKQVVPALLETLNNTDHPDIVDSCIIALAKIGKDPSYLKIFERFLSDNRKQVQEAAAVALGILAMPEGVPTLKALVDDTPEGRALVKGREVPFRVRAFAAYGLGLVGYAVGREEVKEDIVATLTRVLESDKSGQKDLRVGAMIGLGLVPVANEALQTATIEKMKKFFANYENDYLARAHVPVSIAKLLGSGHPRSAEFATLFSDTLRERRVEKEVKQSCVIALGLLTKEDSPYYSTVEKALEYQIKEGDEQARNFSSLALGKIGGKDAMNALLREVSRGKSTFKPWAGLGLGVYAQKAKERGIAFELKTISDTLREALRAEGNASYVGAYSIALGLLGDIEAKDLILEKMKKTSEEVSKGYCCVGLGLLNASDAKEDLSRLVRENTRKPELLQQAAIALGLLSDKAIVPDLLKLLEDAQTLAVQSAIATALGFIGDQRSIDPLIAMLKNPKITELARGFAAVALGIVGDKEPLPWNSKIGVDVNYLAFTRVLSDHSGGTGILDIL